MPVRGFDLPLPFLRRRPRGLLWFWVVAIALAGLLYAAIARFPALTELLRPLYWLIAAALAVFTFRWFRPRARERRRGERRRSDRRDESAPDESGTQTSPAPDESAPDESTRGK